MRTMLKITLLAGLLLTVAACGGAAQPSAPAAAPQGPGFTTISVADLKARLDTEEALVVLDVRTPEEYSNDGHIAGSTLIPVDQIAQRAGELDQSAPIACICRSGNRSRTACEQLAQAGFTNLVNVDGGMRAWAAAGYPVEAP